MKLRLVVWTLIVFVCGVGIGRQFSGSGDEVTGRVRLTDDADGVADLGRLQPELPGESERGLGGLVDRGVERLGYRHVAPEVVREVPRVIEEDGTHVEVPGLDLADRDSTHDRSGDVQQGTMRLDQVSHRGDGLLRVWAHGDSSDYVFDFRLRALRDAQRFDVIAADGDPIVREQRCWVCDPDLAVGVGMALVAHDDELYRSPYVSAEANLALLSPRLRLTATSILTQRDAGIFVGGRLTF